MRDQWIDDALPEHDPTISFVEQLRNDLAVMWSSDVEPNVTRLSANEEASAAAASRQRREARRVRWMLPAGLVAASIAAVAVVAISRDNDTSTVRDPGTSEPFTSDLVIAATPTSDTPPPVTLVDTSTTTTVPDLALPDLSGTQGGLFLPPELVPAPLVLVTADVSDGTRPESYLEGLQTETWLASYSPDRSTVTAVVKIQVFSPANPEMLGGFIPVTPEVAINGNPLLTTTASTPWQLVGWTDGDRTFLISEGSSTANLVDIAQSLVQRADGGYDVRNVPPGFTQVPMPTAAPPMPKVHTTAYAVPGSSAGARPEIILYLFDAPDQSAEQQLMVIPSRVAAVEIGGRRMIVERESSISVIWDLADGTQARLEYRPTDTLPVEQRADFAIELATQVQRTTETGWTILQNEAAANHRTLTPG